VRSKPTGMSAALNYNFFNLPNRIKQGVKATVNVPICKCANMPIGVSEIENAREGQSRQAFSFAK